MISVGNMYRKGARRWRKLYRINGHLFQAKRFSKVWIQCLWGKVQPLPVLVYSILHYFPVITVFLDLGNNFYFVINIIFHAKLFIFPWFDIYILSVLNVFRESFPSIVESLLLLLLWQNLGSRSSGV